MLSNRVWCVSAFSRQQTRCRQKKKSILRSFIHMNSKFLLTQKVSFKLNSKDYQLIGLFQVLRYTIETVDYSRFSAMQKLERFVWRLPGICIKFGHVLKPRTKPPEQSKRNERHAKDRLKNQNRTRKYISLHLRFGDFGGSARFTSVVPAVSFQVLAHA